MAHVIIVDLCEDRRPPAQVSSEANVKPHDGGGLQDNFRSESTSTILTQQSTARVCVASLRLRWTLRARGGGRNADFRIEDNNGVGHNGNISRPQDSYAYKM